MTTKVNTSAFYTIRSLRTPSGTGEPPPPPPPPPTAIKFHTGMYLTPFKTTPFASTLADLNSFTCLRGVQMRYDWRDLETTQGNYSIGFDDIDAKLASMTPTSKRFILFIEFKSLNTNDKTAASDVVPDYILNGAAYDGGQQLYDSANPTKPLAGGKLVKMWNLNVRTRMQALLNAYGARYNSHPLFEGIGFVESAFSNLIGTVPANWEQVTWVTLYKWLETAKIAFPNTVVYQFCNYTRPLIRIGIDGGTFDVGGAPYTVAGFAADGIAIGNPNTLPNEFGLGGTDTSKLPGATTPQPPNVGIYDYYVKHYLRIPIMTSWQPPDYRWTKLGDGSAGGHLPTIQELYDYIKIDLHSHYLFITPATGNTPDSWVAVKNWLNANPSIKNSLTGGLNTTKPTCYAAITTT